MPSIWNVSNSYNVNSTNNKKVSSKLTFEVGERFSGKIVSKGEGNEVTIRLSDGWQFNAEVEGSLEGLENGSVKLEVEGYKNGKLKLKLVSDGQGEGSETSLEAIISKEGLKKKDELLLKEMVKFNIPLTKENINKIRSLVEFGEKISNSENEIDKFIKSYLMGKDIDLASPKGQATEGILKDFLNEFKTLNKEDILFFLENDIEFSKESIESYKKMFKDGNESLDGFFKSIKEEMGEFLDKGDKNVSRETNLEPSKNVSRETFSNLNDEESIKNIKSVHNEVKIADEVVEKLDGEVNPKNLEKLIGEAKEKTSNSVMHPNVYENKEKVSILSVLKEIIKNGEGLTNSETKEVLNKLIDEKGIIDGEDGFSKEMLSELQDELSSIKPKEAAVINKNGQSTVENSNLSQNIVDKDDTSTKELIKSAINEIGERLESSSKEIIKQDIKNNIENLKETIKEMINSSKLGGETGEKILNLIKNNLNSFKLLNSINNEYYYLDIPIKREDKEYPCKLIIKDNRKDGKKIDKNNVKMVVSVNTLNLGTVDGFLTFKDKKLQVDLKCNKNIVKSINKEKEKLQQSLNNLGFKVNISVIEKVEEVSLTGCREFFQGKHKGLIDKKV